MFIINYYLKNMLIKFVNLENYSIEDFYIGEYTLKLIEDIIQEWKCLKNAYNIKS